MRTQLMTFLAIAVSFCNLGFAQADDKTTVTKTLRIGAVAYSPSVVTVFNDLKKYLNQNGLPSDYVLYSNYDAMVRALEKREIDMAWNTPMAHAQYHVRNNGECQTLVMRDVDKGVRSVVIARVDRQIANLKDLKGKTLALGSNQSAEATVLPLYYLRKQGNALNGVNILDLTKVVDFKNNPCCSPQHVVQAVVDGKADAGIVTESMWRSVQKRNGQVQLRKIWTSPEFNHCVFTARPEVSPETAKRFRELMLQMNPNDPATANVMRLEGTRRWIPGDSEGFEDLIHALKDRQ